MDVVAWLHCLGGLIRGQPYLDAILVDPKRCL